MNKQYIIDEIIRTTEENGGNPLGKQKFEKETGIKQSDWLYKHWAKWSDALREAGFEPNQLQGSLDETYIMDSLINLIRELQKFPSMAEIRFKAHSTPGFPAHNTFATRLGNKAKMLNKILDYCKDKPDLLDIYNICNDITIEEKVTDINDGDSPIEYGFVYLMKSGRFYKIGVSNNPERRNYEIGIKLPENLDIIHRIRTDDPFGIEAYWHKRFEAKRKQGEWFELSASDVRTFRRRKFM